MIVADPIPAANTQGATHGFVLLKASDGRPIAAGELTQVAHGAQVRSRLTFHFRDGSVDDDVTVFRQGRILKLISDHHTQKGPSFPQALDLFIDVPKSQATWKDYKDGRVEVKTDHVETPEDLANGLVPLVLQNVAPRMGEAKVSYIVGSPKPRVVKLSIKPEGMDSYFVAGLPRRAKKYKIHIELGGLAGVVAPIIGKQPSDINIWVADGDIPTVVRTEGALYEGGPIWTMVQAVPTWPASRP